MRGCVKAWRRSASNVIAATSFEIHLRKLLPWSWVIDEKFRLVGAKLYFSDLQTIELPSHHGKLAAHHEEVPDDTEVCSITTGRKLCRSAFTLPWRIIELLCSALSRVS
jgi:hypothetical protein